MAYNVLKGNVQFINSTTGSIESMVDDYSNQTIAGIKTFTNQLTASGGFRGSVDVRSPSGIFTDLTVSNKITHNGDTDTFIHLTDDDINIQAGGLNFIDITQDTVSEITFNEEGADIDFRVEGDSNTHLLYVNAGTNKVGIGGVPDHTLTVAGDISASVNVSASVFHGSGAGLSGIPAGALNLGNGVENNSGNLVAKLSGSGGLSLTSAGLGVDPNSAFSIGSLASDDEFLVADNNASNALRKATITNLQSYMQSSLNFGGAAGSNTQVQFVDGAGSFAASSNLTFNSTTNILTTQKITASVHVSSSQVFAGQLNGDGTGITSVQKIAYNSFTADFSVTAENDLIGVVTTGSAITASLLAASKYEPGQRLTFKDVSGSCSGSNHIVISASAYSSAGNRIDGQGVLKIEAGFGAVTLASDGVASFFIVSTS